MMALLVPDYGRRIRLRRQALGLTQEELAARIGPKGVDPSTVISWEMGRHKPTRHQGAIEAVLGISLSEPEPDTDPEREQLLAVLADLRERLGKTEEEFSAQKKAVLDEYDERKRRHTGGGDPRQRIA